MASISRTFLIQQLLKTLKRLGAEESFLMKHLSDQVEFKENGRIVELSFYMNS